jgi:single-strand DNA-binding protein
MNIVVMKGVLSRAPEVRDLPSGSQMANLEVVTDHASGRLTVPVAWLDPPDGAALGPGTEILVTGFVRRRFFRAGGSTQSRTEVVAETVVLAGARAKARKAVEKALASAVGGLGD